MASDENFAATSGGKISGSVGGLLQATRIRLGQDVEEISAILRINYRYLIAIEDGRYEDLPGIAYAAGFIRAYAEHLGLDSEEVVLHYKKERATKKDQEELLFPTPMPEGGIPKGAVFLIGLIISVSAYGAWYFGNYEGISFSRLLRGVPQQLESLINTGSTIVTNQESTISDESDELTLGKGKKKNQPPSFREEAKRVKEVMEENYVGSTNIIEESIDRNQAVDVGGQGGVEKNESPAELFSESEENKNIEGNRTNGRAVESSMNNLDQIANPSINSSANELDSQVSRLSGDLDETSRGAVVSPESQKEDEPNNSVQTNVQSTLLEDKTEGGIGAEVDLSRSNLADDSALAVENDDGSFLEQVTLRARANCWIQIREDEADEILLTRLLQKGDEYQVPRKKGLSLSTGNAGALEILVDNIPVPSIGSFGVIKRGISLDPEQLRIVSE